MVDRSDLPFEENLSLSKDFVKIAHAAGIYIEGEVGKTGSVSGNYGGILTDPEEASRYAKETGVDAVAVNVGNVHGYKPKDMKIDLEAIEKLAAVVSVPMTVHGASGIPYETMSKMAKAGITKFNMQTHLSVYAVKALENYLDETRDSSFGSWTLGPASHRKRQLKTISEFVYGAWGEELGRNINAVGSNGKSWI
jgi:tagatose 1,6-diphosphate aldolase GatY/KbaY